MTLEQLNALEKPAAVTQFSRCCGSRTWVEALTAGRPFEDRKELLDTAERIWFSLSEEDWLEAFSHHPRIGESESRIKDLKETESLSRQEQSGVSGSKEAVRRELAEGNRRYEKKFGYIFICFATGKTAPEMVALLNERLKNDPATEIQIASEEQHKITRLRLERLFDS